MVKILAYGETAVPIVEGTAQVVHDRVAELLATGDSRLWGADAEPEAAIRLGWITSPFDAEDLLDEIDALRSDLLARGRTRFVLCGMGGSSLAPEVITRTAGVPLVILDSTDPSQVAGAIGSDLTHTVAIIASKSGSTVETDSQKRIFEQAFADAGIDPAERIIVITDPGSALEADARERGYRVFSGDPLVGGRYSALTAFGLVPSGLAGADVRQLIADAKACFDLMVESSVANPAMALALAMARTAGNNALRNKLVIDGSGCPIIGLGDWIEQLIAESTGKNGNGVLPVVVGANAPELELNLDDIIVIKLEPKPLELDGAPEPAVVVVFGSLGEQFLLWEFATAYACRLLGVNPFDQPDVEAAKVAARALLEDRQPLPAPLMKVDIFEVQTTEFSMTPATSLRAVFADVFKLVDRERGYIAIHAYLDREKYGELESIRDALAAKMRRPVTFGWGPRFLHSTGQYHKGGPREGLFIQLTALERPELAIPGRPFGFGELIDSQAAGDAVVLGKLHRPVLSLATAEVDKIQAAIAAALS